MLSAALGVGALAVSLATSTLAVPEPPGSTVEVTAIAGEGCPADGTEVVPSPDRTAFSVHMSEFVVATDESWPSRSLSCQLSVRLMAPAGYRAAVAEGLHAQGGVLLPERGEARYDVRYQNAGSPAAQYSHKWINGPSDESFGEVFPVPQGSREFGACGKPQDLTIQVDLAVDTTWADSPAEGLAAVDLLSMGTNLFTWEKC
jgi:hypothetical protein